MLSTNRQRVKTNYALSVRDLVHQTGLPLPSWEREGRGGACYFEISPDGTALCFTRAPGMQWMECHVNAPSPRRSPARAEGDNMRGKVGGTSEARWGWGLRKSDLAAASWTPSPTSPLP